LTPDFPGNILPGIIENFDGGKMNLTESEIGLIDKLLDHPELVIFLGSMVVVTLALFVVYVAIKKIRHG